MTGGSVRGCVRARADAVVGICPWNVCACDGRERARARARARADAIIVDVSTLIYILVLTGP